MKRIILTLCIFIFLPICVWAEDRIKITVSNHQLASITKMVADNLAEIEIIASYNMCPEHYSLKPSDMEKLKNRDLLIYIDTNFEHFINNIIDTHNGKILQVSSIDGLNIDINNYHIWMDLWNIKLILKKIHQCLIKLRPEMKDILDQKLEAAIKDIEETSAYKASKFLEIRPILLLHNSAYYLFDRNIIQKKYIHHHNVTMKNIGDFLNLPQDRCLVSNTNDNFFALEEKINRKIVKIDCEKWQFDGSFVGQYKKIVDVVSANCQ